MQAKKRRREIATVEELASFDRIIDVRSPAEFAEDHLPGAVNYPVLSDAERAQVGTIYKQQSPFEARRLGGALVAANLARCLAEHLQDQPADWRPLVYCWRGGMRSGVFVHWLRLVGWEASQLEGGYKNYRRHVVSRLASLSSQLNLRVVCGPTGSGKTRLLQALAGAGAQVIDLEALAAHRGSVLGRLPDQDQPSQKSFETSLLACIERLDLQQPVFVEAENRKIGRLHLPDELIERMRASPCLRIEAPREARLRLLLEDYAWLGKASEEFAARLHNLAKLHSRETLDRWIAWAHQGELPALFGELLDAHYDPLYLRSQEGAFQHYAKAQILTLPQLDAECLRQAAKQLLPAPVVEAQ